MLQKFIVAIFRQIFGELRKLEEKSFEELINIIEEFTFISNTPNSCRFPRDNPDF